MLEPDIGYRLAHHDDLNVAPRRPRSPRSTDGVVFERRRRAGHRRAHRPRPGPPHRRLPDRGRRAVGRHRRRHRAVRRARRAVRRAPTCSCTPWSGRDLIEPIGAAPPHRRPRLPLVGRAGGADRGAQRRGHAGADPPGPRPGPGEAEQEWIDQAAARFGGSIVVARDLADHRRRRARSLTGAQPSPGAFAPFGTEGWVPAQ